MKIDLSGKSAVVTGSTAGIGRAIAEGLVEAGARVTINGRGEARVHTALAQMRAAFPHAAIDGVAADLSTAGGAAAFLGHAPHCDILVNNLGSANPKPFGEITDDDWLDIFQLNVMSGVRMSRHYLPAMVEHGWGRIVFISSESGVNIPKEMIDYGMTKSAQLAIARGLAESVSGSGVTVNSVLPGPTRSESVMKFVEAASGQPGMAQIDVERAFIRDMRPSSLLGRFTTCEEVANMVVYVCSQQASATTGAALRVDGGVVRSIV